MSALIIAVSLVWRPSGYDWLGWEADSTNGTSKPGKNPIIASHEHVDFLSEISATIRAHGFILFSLRCIRLVSCLALVVITSIAFIQNEGSEQPVNSLKNPFTKGKSKRRRPAQPLGHNEWIEIIQCAFYVCVTITR